MAEAIAASDDVLIGWKAIAAELGVAPPTAMRWARELGLPAFRLGGQVRASRAELARWARAKQTKVVRRRAPCRRRPKK